MAGEKKDLLLAVSSSVRPKHLPVFFLARLRCDMHVGFGEGHMGSSQDIIS